MTDTRQRAIEDQLRQYDQQHVLRFRDQLSQLEYRTLLEQVALIDWSLLTSPNKSLSQSPGQLSRADRATAPRDVIQQPNSDQDIELREAAADRGCELLSTGKIAVITVAGGQGSRLGFEHPKGMYPIGPATDRTLFQIYAEQIQARRQRHGGEIPWYLMTSAATHDETVEFFESNNFFGLGDSTVFFFQQASLPAIDAQSGKVLMDGPGSICLSPDGHGGMVTALKASGGLEHLRSDGVEHLFYHQVDNPTAMICDPVILGLHDQQQSQLTTNVVRKTAPSERMGVLVDIEDNTEIIEYSELTIEQAELTDDSGQWVFWAGNTAIHVFRRDFLEYLTEDGIRLPLHRAHKKVNCIDQAGNRVIPEQPNAFKFERFIFDALPMAERTLIVEGNREREFNPVKNADGGDSPATAQAALSRIGREWLSRAGYPVVEDSVVEISPLVALDAEELGRRLTQGDVTMEDLVSN